MTINVYTQEFKTEVQNAISIIFRSQEVESMMSASVLDPKKFHQCKERAKKKAYSIIMDRIKEVPPTHS